MTMTWSRLQSHTVPTEPDSQAFDALFQQNWARICEVLFRLTGDWQEAEDLALETFLRLYQQPPSDFQNLSGWLYRVATNLGLNALRSRKRRRFYETQDFAGETGELPGMDLEDDPAWAVEKAQERQHVRGVLAKMKPHSALLLILRYSGLSYAELAAALDIAPGSVGTMLARAEREFAKRYRQSILDIQ